MKKNTIIILLFVAVILLLSVFGYNRMVNLDQGIKKNWSLVESQYQRRADLIPNLVATVKGYATHESSTLEGVVAARAKATQITIDPKNLTPEKLQQYQAAQGQVTSALGKLMVLTENYPNLKANDNFKELQAQLEGTENRITVARNNFTGSVEDYNNFVLKLPSSIIASIFGYKEKNYFISEKGSEKAPSVKF